VPNNSVPYEIIGAPFQVYVAPVLTAFPVINAAHAAVLAAGWTLIGTSGNLNYDQEGITIEHTQEVNSWRSLGDSGIRKQFRIQEEMRIRLTLADVTLEQYRRAINDNAVSDTPAGSGTAGFRTLPLSRGSAIATVALLMRGPSPYGADWTMQYEVPVASQSGNPTIVWKRGEPAMLPLQFDALVDPNATTEFERFGRLVAQDADALP